MPGGGGSSILDMIIRYRNNMNLLRKKSVFSRKSSMYEDGTAEASGIRKKLKFKSARPEQLTEIRTKLEKSRRHEVLKVVVGLAVLLPLLLWGTYSLYDTFRQDSQLSSEVEKRERAQEIQKSHDKYLFFIEDGNRWFAQGKWYNAVFQYKNAVEQYLDKYEPNFLLAKAYAYRCIDEGEYCEKTRLFIKRLIGKYPDKSEELRRLSKGLENQRSTLTPSSTN